MTIDRVGRWHVAFAAIPDPIPAPGHGKAVGVDRGVTVGAALSTGELLSAPGLIGTGRKRMLRLERKLARAIAAGHAVTANREPQLLLLQA